MRKTVLFRGGKTKPVVLECQPSARTAPACGRKPRAGCRCGWKPGN